MLIPFHPANVYPLLESYSELAAQDHAEQVDCYLGFQTAQVEMKLLSQGCRLRAGQSSKQAQQLWIGLAPQRLQTPYVDIRRLLYHLDPRPGQRIVDLGAAYGRMGFVIAHHYPEVQFIGYEYVGERVREARRVMARRGLDGSQIRMEHVDLSLESFVPAVADIYFLYDFGSPKTIEKVLHDLRRIARHRPITIMSRGKYMAESLTTKHAWLNKQHEFGINYLVCGTSA